jgi:hypothetical protein
MKYFQRDLSRQSCPGFKEELSTAIKQNMVKWPLVSAGRAHHASPHPSENRCFCSGLAEWILDSRCGGYGHKVQSPVHDVAKSHRSATWAEIQEAKLSPSRFHTGAYLDGLENATVMMHSMRLHSSGRTQEQHLVCLTGGHHKADVKASARILVLLTPASPMSC